MTVKIEPFRCSGRMRSIPSKSFAHRALICAALADGPSRLTIEKSSIDIDATRDALTALGATIQAEGSHWQVRPIELRSEVPLVNAVESGSTLRFLLPVAAALYKEVDFTGQGRLPDRPIGVLLDSMAKNGCRFTGTRLPLTINGPLRGSHYELPGDVSSQFVSGLLMAAPVLGGDVSIELTSKLESRDYVTITLDVMESFGVRAEDHSGEAPTGEDPMASAGGYIVPGGQRFRGTDYEVEGDWSNAAFFLVGGALSGDVTMSGLEVRSVQGDRGVLKVLEDFGAVVKTGRTIRVAKGGRRPFAVDLSLMPDSLPILAVLAASCDGGVSRFYNGARLRLKESDRLMTVARMIRELGGRVEELEDGLNVYGTGGLMGGTTSSFGDHRLAMAAAIAAVISEGAVEIRQPWAVEKSYPAFYEDLTELGGIVHGIELRQ